MNFTTAMQPQLGSASILAAQLRNLVRGRDPAQDQAATKVVHIPFKESPALANEMVKQAHKSYRYHLEKCKRQRHNSQRNSQWLKKLDQHQLTQHTKQ